MNVKHAYRYGSGMKKWHYMAHLEYSVIAALRSGNLFFFSVPLCGVSPEADHRSSRVLARPGRDRNVLPFYPIRSKSRNSGTHMNLADIQRQSYLSLIRQRHVVSAPPDVISPDVQSDR